MTHRKDNYIYFDDSNLFCVKKKEYLVQCEGYSSEHSSWIPGVDLTSDMEDLFHQEEALAKKERKRKHEPSIQKSPKKIKTEEVDITEIMDLPDTTDHPEITDHPDTTDLQEITHHQVTNPPEITKKATLAISENVPITMMSKTPVKYVYSEIPVSNFYPKPQVRQERQSAPNKSNLRSASFHPQKQQEGSKAKKQSAAKAPNKSSKRSASSHLQKRKKRSKAKKQAAAKASNKSSKRSASFHSQEQKKRLSKANMQSAFEAPNKSSKTSVLDFHLLLRSKMQSAAEVPNKFDTKKSTQIDFHDPGSTFIREPSQDKQNEVVHVLQTAEEANT